MSPLHLLLVVLVILLIVGGLPAWNLHSYGPWPSGVGLVLLVVLVLVLFGRL